jgi:hypothetical protein
MNDDRVPRGTAFGGEDGGDGLRREGVGAEAVDGFGGEGDEAAGAQDFRCAGEVRGELCVEMEGAGHE